MAVVLFACVCGASANVIPISVTGTANSTALGYTSGQSYTFSWTVSDAYPGCVYYDSFIASENKWCVDSLASPVLLTDVSGDGLSGTYSRPATSTYEYLKANSSGLSVYAGNRSPATTSLGLTANGVEVQYVMALMLQVSDLDYSNTSFVDPAAWLSTYEGTYAQSASGLIRVIDENSSSLDFTATSVTIGAVPEPATAGLLVVSGTVLVGIRHLKKAANYYRT